MDPRFCFKGGPLLGPLLFGGGPLLSEGGVSFLAMDPCSLARDVVRCGWPVLYGAFDLFSTARLTSVRLTCLSRVRLICLVRCG